MGCSSDICQLCGGVDSAHLVTGCRLNLFPLDLCTDALLPLIRRLALPASLGIGIGQTANALVGNRLGADDEMSARCMALQAISFASLVSAVAALIAWFATPCLFALMGGEDPYLKPAVAYMNTVLLGTVFFALASCSLPF